jgi:CBS domain-containing protein
MLTARDVMTPDPITIGPDATLAEAIQCLRANQIHGLPVVDDGRIVGIITDRDLRTLLGPGARSGDLGLLEKPDVSVRSIMTPASRMQCAALDTPLPDAMRLVAKHRIGALPVLDEGGGLLGIVSVTDLLVAAADVMDPSRE